MKQNAKEAEKLAETLKKMDSHPIVQKILEEEKAATLVKRKEVALKIEKLEQTRDEAMPRLQAEKDLKEEEYKKAKEALDIAAAEFNKASAALSSQRFQFSHQISMLQDILFETAAPEIDAAIEFFREKLNFSRSPGRISRRALGSELNPINMRRKFKVESNAQAIRNALVYCQTVIKELEQMKLTPALDKEKIEQMKNGIPDITEYSEAI